MAKRKVVDLTEDSDDGNASPSLRSKQARDDVIENANAMPSANLPAARKSRRMTTDIGWVDVVPLSSVRDVLNHLASTDDEWNLYVCQEGDVRHCFVIRKRVQEREFSIYDYQGRYFLRDPNFCTSVVYSKLKAKTQKDNPLGYKVTFGQKHEIFGDDNNYLCMKNSAFVCKYKKTSLSMRRGPGMQMRQKP